MKKIIFTIFLFASMYSGESSISIGGIKDNFILIDDDNRESGGGDFSGAKIGYLYSLDTGDFPSLWLDASFAYGQNQGVIKYDDEILSDNPKYLAFKLGIAKRFYLGVPPYFYFATKGEMGSSTLLAKREQNSNKIMATRINIGIAGQLGLYLTKNHEMVLEAGYSYSQAFFNDVIEGNKKISDLKSSSSGVSVYLGYIYHFNDDEDFIYENVDDDAPCEEEVIKKKPPYEVLKLDSKPAKKETKKNIDVEPKKEIKKKPKPKKITSYKEDNLIFEDNLPMVYKDKSTFIDMFFKKCNDDGDCNDMKFSYWDKRVIFYFTFKTINDKKMNLSKTIKRIQIINKIKNQYPTWVIVEATKNIQKVKKLDSDNKEIMYRIYLK